jgi:UPF0755 protein
MNIFKTVFTSAVVHRKKVIPLLLVAMFLVFDFRYYAVSPVDQLSVAKTIDIPKGSGFLRVTDILDQAGLVKNRFYFWMLALGKKTTRNIRAGEYELSSGMSPAKILDILVRGEIKGYYVILPEDFTVSEMAQRLATYRLIQEKEFMTLATDRIFLDSLGIEGNSLEGYLYPDTYLLDRSMTTEEIIRMIVRRFWKKVTPELRERAEEIGLTLTEWVTLASIIGKESGNSDEKPLISAVFHNRLKRGMKLQSDPTAVYLLEPAGVPTRTIRKEDLKSDTPHNTYRIDGLPPSPIANPSIDSLRAALYPADVKYLYFVSKNDGSHHFSTSFNAHNQAVSKYQANRQKK